MSPLQPPVFADGIDVATRKKFASPTLRFETERLDLAAVGEQCDVAVHNANHGTLARLLLAGRPMVQLLLTLEQTVLTRAVDGTGAAETVPPGAQDVGEAFARKLGAVKSDRRYAEAARRFAAKYSDFDPPAQVARLAGRVEELLYAEAGRSVGPSQIMNASPQRPRRSAPAGVFRA